MMKNKGDVNMLPHIQNQGDKQVLMVHDMPFIMLAGEVHNSNSSSLKRMEKIWDQAIELNLNSLLLPITWELIEPKEDQFDFQLVDGLIFQARQRHMKIGFLWFGSWKNAQCYYAPEWVKTDMERFPRGEIEKGKNSVTMERFHGMSYSTLSMFGEETKKADAKAFAKFMEHIKLIDEKENTVVIVQVENEAGLLGTNREYSDIADELFHQNVDEKLLAYLKENKDSLSESLSSCQFFNGTWKEVFKDMAEEVFSAYYIAQYIEYVASAGKRAYNLPMVVNCWLDKGQEAGRYPTGGPVEKVMNIWQYSAPSIDIIAPDIYVSYFYDVCDQYTTKGNSLFIAECATHSYTASRILYTIGHYHSLCFSPFGIEDLGQPFSAMEGVLFGIDVQDKALSTPQDPIIYSQINKQLKQLMPLITSQYGTPHLQGATFELSNQQVLRFDEVAFEVSFEAKFLSSQFGGCLIVQSQKNEFYVIAYGCQLHPYSLLDSQPYLDYLLVEEGNYDHGLWQRERRLNGDEITTMCFNEPTLLKIKLFVHD